ncbi:hypothetical protein EXIGLDRAFT_732216 [Exidia glandulosa HHB12029]|uniref:Uncharacterized protein n=1 Tax=Exidia glandulosa HHB12029 TaxID=1314781 RepID=A0A165KU88_EXIGL|nr:hypothetical protein EXIGLDRAFT_732216 [Exidia glandulosa HHB12029]
MCLPAPNLNGSKWPRLEPLIESAIRFAKANGRRVSRRAPPSATAATFAATAAMFADTLPPVVGCGCIWMSSEDDPTWPCPQHILLHSSLLTRALLPLPTTRRTPACPPTSRPGRVIDALDLDALTYNWLPKLPAFSIVEAIDKYAVAVRDDPTAYEPVPQTKYPTRKQISSVGAAMKDEIRDEYLAAMVWAKDSGALGRRRKRDSDPATTIKAIRKERADEEAHLKEWSHFFADPLKPVLKELAGRNKTQTWLTAKARPLAPRTSGNSSEPFINLEDMNAFFKAMAVHDEDTPGISSVGRNVQRNKNRVPFPDAPPTQAPSTPATTSVASTTPARASRVLKRPRDEDEDELDEDEDKPNSGSTRPSSKRARADVARPDANHAQTANQPNATGQGIGSSSSQQTFGQAIAPVAPAMPSTAAPAAVPRARGLRAPPNPGEPHEQVERFSNEQYPCTRFAPKEWTLYCDLCWQDPTRRAQWHNEKSLENHKKRCQAAPLPPGLQSA